MEWSVHLVFPRLNKPHDHQLYLLISKRTMHQRFVYFTFVLTHAKHSDKLNLLFWGGLITVQWWSCDQKESHGFSLFAYFAYFYRSKFILLRNRNKELKASSEYRHLLKSFLENLLDTQSNSPYWIVWLRSRQYNNKIGRAHKKFYC